MPLLARLKRKGREHTAKIAQKQRADFKRQMLSTKQKSNLAYGLLDTRLKINNVGELYIRFTKKIVFHKKLKTQFIEKINNSTSLNDSEPIDSPVEVFAMSSNDSEEENDAGPKEPLIESWQLAGIDESGITVLIRFREPLQVSAGDNPDILFVQL